MTNVFHAIIPNEYKEWINKAYQHYLSWVLGSPLVFSHRSANFLMRDSKSVVNSASTPSVDPSWYLLNMINCKSWFSHSTNLCCWSWSLAVSHVKSINSKSWVPSIMHRILTTYFENKFKSRWQDWIKALMISSDTWLFLWPFMSKVETRCSQCYHLLLSILPNITFNLLFKKGTDFGKLDRSRTGIKREIAKLGRTWSFLALLFRITVVDECRVFNVATSTRLNKVTQKVSIDLQMHGMDGVCVSVLGVKEKECIANRGGWVRSRKGKTRIKKVCEKWEREKEWYITHTKAALLLLRTEYKVGACCWI